MAWPLIRLPVSAGSERGDRKEPEPRPPDPLTLRPPSRVSCDTMCRRHDCCCAEVAELVCFGLMKMNQGCCIQPPEADAEGGGDFLISYDIHSYV